MTPLTPETITPRPRPAGRWSRREQGRPIRSSRPPSRRPEGGLRRPRSRRSTRTPDEPLEVQHIAAAAGRRRVLGYTITIGERVIRARVESRREGRPPIYKQALYEGRTAGLLEQSRPTFQQRLGNVPPRTKVAIAIDVLRPLAFIAVRRPTARPWGVPLPDGRPACATGGRTPDAAELPDRRCGRRAPVDLHAARRSTRRARAARRTRRRRAATTARRRWLERGEALDRDIVARWDRDAGDGVARVRGEGGGPEGDDGPLRARHAWCRRRCRCARGRAT